MARRRRPHRGHANHERWLVSYADFITLLFAFFVVMFASSHADKGRAEQVSESIKRALEEDEIVSAIAGILGGTVGKKDPGNAQMKGPGGVQRALAAKPPVLKPEEKYAELVPSLRLLEAKLQSEIASGMLQVNMEPRGLVVSLRQAAFFPPGQDSIDPSTYGTIEKVAATIRALPNKVRLEGHTDSVPIRNSRYRSNWELSTARGVTMLELLNHSHGIPETRLSVGGYADTIPIDLNTSVEGRAHNRRVDIVILNQYGLQGEPKAK